MVDAVRNADLPIIQAVGLTYCVVVLIINTVSKPLPRAEPQTADYADDAAAGWLRSPRVLIGLAILLFVVSRGVCAADRTA